MRRILATFLLATFALLVTTFAGLSVFAMHDDAGMGAHDIGCLNLCLSSATALTNAVLPAQLPLGFLAALFAIVLVATGAQPLTTARRALRWREGIGKAHRRLGVATVILRN